MSVFFRAMVEKSNDGNHTSRAVTVKEMMNITGRSLREVRLVIYTFSQSGRRFLTAPPVAEIDEDSVITIAHESLIKRWTRLKGWANDEAEAAEMYVVCVLLLRYITKEKEVCGKIQS